MMFAARTDRDLTQNRLNRLLLERRSSGSPVIDLTESNPTRCGFAFPSSAILASLSRPENLIYDPHPAGLHEARTAVSSLYAERGRVVPPDHVVLTASTSEAYSFLFRLLADPGDQILVPVPSYPLLDLLASMNDVVLTPYHLDPGLGFAMDLDEIRAAAASGRTRAVVVVNPGNPVGMFISSAESDALEKICAQHRMAIISDEVFLDYANAGAEDRATTLAGRSRALTFALNGLSKMLALPQLKLGWIAASGPEPVLAQALARLELIADTYLSVNTPVQRALSDLLALREVIQRDIKSRLDSNRGWLMESLRGQEAARCLPSDGGWCAVLEVPRTVSEEEWTLRLLQDDGVLAHPGYFFDFPRDGYLVVSLLPPADLFREGAGRLLRRLKEGLAAP